MALRHYQAAEPEPEIWDPQAPIFPEPGPGRPLPRLHWSRLARLGAAGLALILALLVFLTVYAALTLPDSSRLGAATGSLRVLDRNGQLVAEIGNRGVPRRAVPLSRVSTVMQQAILAAEDRNFYREGAFDLRRIAKALAVDVLARRPEQGASTITQQLARNAFLSSDKTVLRKLREAILAGEIDSRYGKKQILEMYLDTIYFGENAYGVEAAALVYFGKHASALNLAESSLLAGLPKAPSSNDPFVNPQAAFARQHYVLQGMLAMGAITPAQARVVDPQTSSQNRAAMAADLRNGQPLKTDLAPAFVRYVEGELHKRFGENSPIFDQSVTVTTTLDLGLQRIAQQAVKTGIARLGRGANNGALLMLDPRNGAILAMVGSADYANSAIGGQFNVVTAQRRPGSSFKPYVYAAGFASGRLKPETILDDTPQEARALGGVQDFDHQFLGRLPASEALVQSRNIPTEQAMERIGVDQVISFAHSLGITSELAPNASTGIGSSAVRMLDQAAAYAAFADGGTRVTPHAVARVTDAGGRNVLDQSAIGTGARVMPAGVACSINSILSRYPGVWGLGFNRPTAGKSGTTDGFVDAWYMSYTPRWVVATWAGHTTAGGGEVGMQGVYGTTMAQAVAVPFVNALPSSSGQFSASCGGRAGRGGEDKGQGGGQQNNGHGGKHKKKHGGD